MRSKLLGGALVGVALILLVLTQILFPGFATAGWVSGLCLFVLGGLLMLGS